MERNRTLPRDRHISQVKRLRGFLGNNVAGFIFYFARAVPNIYAGNGLCLGKFFGKTRTASSRSRAPTNLPWWNRYWTINSFITPVLRRPDSWWQERVDIHPQTYQTRTGLRTTLIPISDLYWQTHRSHYTSPTTNFTREIVYITVFFCCRSSTPHPTNWWVSFKFTTTTQTQLTNKSCLPPPLTFKSNPVTAETSRGFFLTTPHPFIVSTAMWT